MATDINNIDGKKIINQATGQELTMHLKSKEQMEVEIEIACNHPKLQAELKELLKSENYEYDIFFGACFAYCGITLDSSDSTGGYNIAYLYEQLGRALINKRENMAVGVNTIPTPGMLTNTLAEMKEAHEEQVTKVTTETKIH